jgi:hypothetical protein
MANREEALRKIFDAFGESARLSDEQKRELLGHLDDAVEAKVAAGLPEMEAVAEAFVEFGDLRRIAKELPAPVPVAAAAGVPAFFSWSARLGRMGYASLLFFSFAQILIVPPLFNIFLKVHVALPTLTLLYWDLSEGMRRFWPAVVVALAGLGAAQYSVRRPGKWKAALDLAVALVGTLLLAGVFVGTLLPYVSLLEGLHRRH